ncbi:hypothetical protein Poli38472_013049 [Pythium oligandrum]|uniref:HECT-type E3 ubiquitin transferase n=1 Tax=Pythium oligandrum TaxID=41045 RepID=A0A8K1FM26_PYTOL|nr:hypothetical protein Poli38472_013049 [Pythium oligandrum]|eukprot:TMW64427.1 hypothetical protein Poli38472_013049 [Pythium oligandrum]
MDAEAYKAQFQAIFAAYVTQGLEPTEAAAKTLQQLQGGAAQQQEDVGTNEEHVDALMQEKAEEEVVAAVDEIAVVDHVDSEMEEHGQQEEDEDMDLGERMSVVMEAPSLPLEAPSSPAVVPPPAPVTVTETLGTQLMSALYHAGEVDDYREVKKLLYQIFSDISTLNAAFAEQGSGAVDPQEEWWAIGRDELQEVYALLVDALGRSSDQTALQNTWRNALEMMVNQPWNVCSTWTTPVHLRFVLILFDHPLLFDPDYLNVVGGLCKLFYHLTEGAKDLLRAQWNTYFSNDELYRLLQVLQQSITVCLYGSKKMDLVYAACAVLKELHTINLVRDPPFASYDEFYNDAVNSEVDIVRDYGHSIFFLKKRHEGSGEEFIPHRMLSELSFCDYPFVLDAASKSRVLQIDSDLEQRSRLQDAMMSRLVMNSVSPYLLLRVRRDNVIEDALQQLVRASPETLKKPMKVKFIGEEGVDEGGVRKEFFQILIRQLLDPAFGMFTYDDETRTMWFNSDSLEATMEFELIGILLGLAIYNAVILDLQFPHIVYKKLMQCPLSLADVEIAMPALGKGLRQLLEFDGNVEEVFQRNFEYSYEVYGAVKTVELKPGGSSIAVTNENRDEYVKLYVEHILNTSVERQYNAFHKGFHLVCNGEVLEMFRWEELHLLICGSPELDFEALEEAAHYEDGFTENSECIRNFWSVVHELTLEEKKKLLMFTTGSDRAPIRGLSNMVFVISRNGPDSDRLPTAHTCFNHLLLPDYSSREKLKERLLLAINQAEGFGLR